MQRAFRYRFYPTAQQADLLSRTFGCVRWVYNRALTERSRAWKEERRRLSYADSSGLLTAWKREPESAWLNEVSSVPLQQALRHLQAGYTAFWAGRGRYPSFKCKRRSRASAEFTRSAFRWQGGQLWLAKCSEPLPIRWSRPLPPGAEPSTVTVSRDSAGRWFVSMLVEDLTVQPLSAVDAAVGLDAGITSLLTLSTGEKIANPRHERRDRQRLARAQRRHARKQNGSRNREKARVKMAREHARIADRRRDFLHKLTTRLVRENQTIVVEGLSVSNLLGNHSLARAISDAAWSELRAMLKYKCAWYGREFVVVDRWLSTTKTCNGCGSLREPLPLAVRRWTCPDCGALHDRDVNAARNVLAAGLAVTACGDCVRPHRDNPRGQRSAKQERRPARAGTPGIHPRGGSQVRSHFETAPIRPSAGEPGPLIAIWRLTSTAR